MQDVADRVFLLSSESQRLKYIRTRKAEDFFNDNYNPKGTAVFPIKYLRTPGFSAANDVFADNAWYFRNSLVRSNYTDIRNGVYATTKYLEAFFGNLLLGESNMLQNRNLRIDWPSDIEKVDIGWSFNLSKMFSKKTINNVWKLFAEFGYSYVSRRSDVMEVLGLKESGASKFISNLLYAGVIEPVKRHEKGRYRFENAVWSLKPPIPKKDCCKNHSKPCSSPYLLCGFPL